MEPCGSRGNKRSEQGTNKTRFYTSLAFSLGPIKLLENLLRLGSCLGPSVDKLLRTLGRVVAVLHADHEAGFIKSDVIANVESILSHPLQPQEVEEQVFVLRSTLDDGVELDLVCPVVERGG